MKYLLILFVIAVALAPLSHFLPSKRQRAVARLREFAAVNGLFVEFRNLPGSEQKPVSRRGGPDQVIYYGKRLPPARGKPRKALAWQHRDGAWSGVGHREAAPGPLADLPAAVLAASLDEGSCGVYWREAGGEEEGESILRVVTAWAAQLGSKPRPLEVPAEDTRDDFS